MADIVITVLGKIAEYAVHPIKRQLGYLFCFSDNVETLKDEVEKLNDVRARVKIHVNAALRNVEIIDPVVERWLFDAEKNGDQAQIIIQNKAKFPKGCSNHWCLNLKQRYVLSRNAKKKRKDIIRLQQDGNFEKISFRAPFLPVMASTSSTRSFCRKWILDKFIEKLMDDNISMIGICGMGGVGKTTMAEQILDRVTKEKLFNDCAMAIIGQKNDLAKVQSDIAEMLGLELHEQNPIARVAKLHRRLEDRRLLIILDDVWEEFDLKILGITFQGLQKGCKVLFTSREQGLWRKLKTKIDFPLSVLTEYEAWDLFEEMVSDSLEDKPELQHIAKEIVKECGGLPLALVTLGGALVGKSTHLWKDTLRQLRTDYPMKISGMSAKVYQSLELSYNFLEDEDAKSLFLLCCLFEEDFEIPIEDLVRMGIGLRLFRGITGLEQARDRVLALLEQLKSCNLLSGKKEIGYNCVLIDNNAHVKMHDIVRDAGKYISRVEKRALVVDNCSELRVWQELDTIKDFLWISIISKEVTDFPIEFESRRVKLLRCSNTVVQSIHYEGMQGLRVLDVCGKESPELQTTIRFPSTLQTLYFRECNLTKIINIGDLPNLESLSFVRSHMEVLPIEKGHLSNLLSLDLTNCSGLKKIQPGVIQGLCQLQELYMGDVILDWEGRENGEGINPSVREFESLTNLHTLHINFPDSSVLPRSPILSKLRKYQIQIGAQDPPHFSSHYEKCCSISLHTFVPTEGDAKFLSVTAEELLLEGKYTKDLVLELVKDGSQSLRILDLVDIDAIEYLANAEMSLLLLTVESLSLWYLDNLQQMSRYPLVLGSFRKLKKLEIYRCGKLRNIFQVAIVKELVHLEIFYIRDCESMEEIISNEREEDATNKLVFPILRNLEIWDLPCLISFCRGIHEFEFPKLKYLELWKLPQLESAFFGLSNQSIFPHKVSFPSLESLQLFDLINIKDIWCGQLQGGSFLNLASLTVEGCHNLHSVLTPLLAKCLVHLQNLFINNCSLLELVISKDDEQDEMENTVLLPKLEIVDLSKLPALESFCHVTHNMEFPMLSFLHVIGCPELKTFSSGCVHTPKLNNVRLSDLELDEREETLWVENLNNTIRHLHKQQQQQQHHQQEQEDPDEEENKNDSDDYDKVRRRTKSYSWGRIGHDVGRRSENLIIKRYNTWPR